MRILLALLLAAAAHAETSSYVAPLGSWVLCDAGLTGPFCAVGGIPHGTYGLFISATDTRAVAFRYKITAHLKDGSTETRTGLVDRAAEGATITTLAFGAAVVSSEVTVQELGVLP